MPAVTHEPSGLIAIRALDQLERERRADLAAREAAEAQTRAQTQAAAREAAAAQARAEAQAAEQAARAEQARRHEERLRAADIEARIRALQVAHLARVQDELDATAAATRSGGRIGVWAAAGLGVVGLGLAFLFLKGSLAAPTLTPSPALAVAADDTVDEAREAIRQLRKDLQHMTDASEAERRALQDAIASAEARVAAAPPPATPVASKRPPAKPTTRPATDKPVEPRIKVCDSEGPLDGIDGDCAKK